MVVVAVTEGIDLFIHHRQTGSGRKTELETEVILIILVVLRSWSQTCHAAQKEELVFGKNPVLSLFSVMLFF